MAITFEQVRAALEPEEPAYNKVAANLGTEALPHLARLVTGDHPMLASKAAYLAGLIGTDQSVDVLQKAARSGDVTVRIAAAAAAGKLAATAGTLATTAGNLAATAGALAPDAVSNILINLIDDADVGVQKVALRAVSETSSDALKARVASLSAGVANTAIRSLSREVLGRLPGSSGDAVAASKKAPKKKSGKSKK